MFTQSNSIDKTLIPLLIKSYTSKNQRELTVVEGPSKVWPMTHKSLICRPNDSSCVTFYLEILQTLFSQLVSFHFLLCNKFTYKSLVKRFYNPSS